MFNAEIVGIADGYRGLIAGEYRVFAKHEFSGILTLGGTILGTSRQPFSRMRVVEDDQVDKVAAMKANYEKMGLDCLVTLGGNGTHKTANLLAQEGLNVIGLPKTIDNDIYGTDVTFGFHTAVDIATEVIDRIHTTAASHGRCMVIEIMGNKVGWLTLYAGIAGGADVILLPEIPHSMDEVVRKVEVRHAAKKNFCIIAVAEGAMSQVEAGLKKKERELYRENQHFTTISQRIAAELADRLGVESRVVIPGHIQRGGTPSAYDRVLATRFGAHAAELIRDGLYGRTVSMSGATVTNNLLADIAGKTKFVPADHQLVSVARNMGISFGDSPKIP
jgi:6-phosphofructokinase 1